MIVHRCGLFALALLWFLGQAKAADKAAPAHRLARVTEPGAVGAVEVAVARHETLEIRARVRLVLENPPKPQDVACRTLPRCDPRHRSTGPAVVP